MQTSLFHKLGGILWSLVVLLIVVLAIYVSVGRLLASSLGAYQDTVLRELNARLPFSVAAQSVSGEWHSFTPVIVLGDLTLGMAEAGAPPIALSEGRIGIDVLDSLRTGSLQMTRLMLDELKLRGAMSADGRVHISGFAGDGAMGQWLRQFLLNVELVELHRNSLELSLPDGQVRNLNLSLRLERDGSYRRVEVIAQSGTDAELLAVAEGVGDPFDTEQFNGELYVDLVSPDIQSARAFLGDRAPPVWAEGAADIQLWLSLAEGETSVQTRIEANDLMLRGSDWQLPLAAVSADARLVQRKKRWTVFASNLELEAAKTDLRIPQLQLDLWGDAARLRVKDVSLAAASEFASGLPDVPARVLTALAALQPTGTVSVAQFGLGDIRAPRSDWELEAEFDDLAVKSWHGAPGVAAASGYVELTPGDGFVVLDSEQMSMDFPTVYRQPLVYDELFGTINISWNEESVGLTSGLMTAVDGDTTARALFGLNIPLRHSTVGLEMDLLVGLQDADIQYREKYIPYVLNESLRRWISAAIGEGVVRDGAFLWRGTLRKHTAPLHTIQLAFNIADTQLRYHTAWPPVEVSEGTVLIDDTTVSVWSDRAQLYDSDVTQLSAESWLDDQHHMQLALAGLVDGSAADVLAVLKHSPLTALTGDAFAGWSASGLVSTRLQLQMDLHEPAVKPNVDVVTQWRDVGLDIKPGALPVRNLDGEFSYNSVRGFGSRNLRGELWGEALSIDVSQAANQTVDIALATHVDMTDVIDWSRLESLSFASGEAAVSGHVVLDKGHAPVLMLDTKLAGVRLDLPSPYGKAALREQSLHLRLPLAGPRAELTVDLQRAMQLRLGLLDGGISGAALAAAGLAPEPVDGLIRVSGHVPQLEVDEWLDFVQQHFFGAAHSDRAKQRPTAGSQTLPLVVEIDQLTADELTLRGRDFTAVLLSAQQRERYWQIQVETDWLRGEVKLPVAVGPDNPIALNINYLDLSAATVRATMPDWGAGEILQLPNISVQADDIYFGGKRLGEIGFNMVSRDELLQVNDIRGSIAHMSLSEPATLAWRQGVGGSTTVLAKVDIEDLGQVLTHFGYQRILETKQGVMNYALQWPGAPADFSLAAAEGAVRMDLGEGSFLTASAGASGALRVVSILNLADVVGRLKLAQVFDSGIPFDTIEGEIFLHSGTIEVTNLAVDGPSSFRFSGVSDVASQSLSGELVATLPVADNLPWVAALAAGLPVAAGVFVVSKVFKRQMNQLSSAVYEIGGSWDEPSAKFDHIFDAGSGESQARSPKGADAEPTRSSYVPDPQQPGVVDQSPP